LIWLPEVGAAIALVVWWRGGVASIHLWIAFLLYLVTMTGIEVGYHRLFSHRAFDATPPLRVALAIAGSMAVQGPLLYWVANHRRHHRFSDRDGDPHSPQSDSTGIRSRALAFLHAHKGWITRVDLQASFRFIPKDLLRDPIIVSLHRQYFLCVAAGLALPALIGALATQTLMGGLHGLLIGGFARVCLTNHAIYSVNSFCHLIGSRPNPTGDRSTNLAILVLPTLGGGWHNNHHARPWSATLSFRPWQIDPGYWLIRAFAALGLAAEYRGARAEECRRLQ
jgi:stearoyl-CoA desaturase (delta-9 desaturase)